jgi:hypothetical protein
MSARISTPWLSTACSGAQHPSSVPALAQSVLHTVLEDEGETQIKQFDRAGPVEEEISGLDVPVDHPRFMSMLETRGGLLDVMGGLNGIQRPILADDDLEVTSVNILGDKEVKLAEDVHVVGANDVRMLELRDRPRLSMESPHDLGVAGHRNREDLQCNMPTHHEVFAEEDARHTAGAESLQNPIFPSDVEVAMATHEELLGLELGEQAVTNHQLRQDDRILRYVELTRSFLDERVDSLRRKQSAFLHQGQELGDALRCRHVSLSAGMFNYATSLKTSGAMCPNPVGDGYPPPDMYAVRHRNRDNHASRAERPLSDRVSSG